MIESLVERLEASVGPDREIDQALMPLLYVRDRRKIGESDQSDPRDVWVDPASDKWVSTAAFCFTESINDAIRLIPAGWFAELKFGKPVGAEREYCHCELTHDADSVDRDLRHDEPFDVEATNCPTPAIAICIVALKARMA